MGMGSNFMDWVSDIGWCDSGGELGDEGDQGSVLIGGGEELGSGAVRFAGDGDGGEPGEAGRGGVAEDGFAGFGMVFAGAELVDGGAGG